MLHRTSPALLIIMLTSLAPAQMREGRAPVQPPPESLKLDPFYKKHLSAGGLPVVSSEKTPDEALHVAAGIIDEMLGNRPDAREALIKARIRVAVMSKDELTTDVPEHSDLTPKDYWDKRARGLGATHERPATSCGEENLLGYESDPYRGESILIHEFAHNIHEIALVALDETFDARLKSLYERAMKKGLWKNTYAAQNHKEYWAEAVQAWFDANLTADPTNGIHNHVGTRAALEEHDPELAGLIAEVFGEMEWRWDRPGAHARTRRSD